MGSFDQWCWKGCFMLNQRNTKPKPQSLPFCESRDKPWTDFTSNQTKHKTRTKSWNHPDSNVSPAVVVAGEDFQMAELDLQTGCRRSFNHFPHMTCPPSPAECSYKIHTSSNCKKVHLSSLTCLLCWIVRQPELLVFVKSLTNKPVAHSSALPYLRPRHPGNALTAEGGGPP